MCSEVPQEVLGLVIREQLLVALAAEQLFHNILIYDILLQSLTREWVDGHLCPTACIMRGCVSTMHVAGM